MTEQEEEFKKFMELYVMKMKLEHEQFMRDFFYKMVPLMILMCGFLYLTARIK